MPNAALESKIREAVQECEGWCKLEKALALAGLIEEHQVRYSVEIGVYGGRSFIPQALAHKQYTGGTAVGIDPWTTEAAQQVVTGNAVEIVERAKEKFKDFDFEGQYHTVQRRLVKYGVQDHARLIRKKSADALAEVAAGIELLHIDGNHGNDVVMSDIHLYLPKVKRGGIVWFDDVMWDSVKPAVEYAKAHCRLVRVFDDNNLILTKI